MTKQDLFIALAQLAVDPPPSVTAQIFAQWIPLDSPIGPVRVAFTDHGVCYLRQAKPGEEPHDSFIDAVHSRTARPLQRAHRAPRGLTTAVSTGKLDTLTLDLSALSDFEQETLNATRQIPRGQTRPYSWIARRIGRPGAVRAVGTALGRNPIPILIPCHRVTRTDGTLGDYIFGAATKRLLLEREGLDLDQQQRLAQNGIRFIGSATTKIVCFPSCQHARRITPRHQRRFRRFDAAQAEGFRACQACQPDFAPPTADVLLKPHA
jgi:methylated-DNA-[protein]-cysteine S-methyltransferase